MFTKQQTEIFVLLNFYLQAMLWVGNIKKKIYSHKHLNITNKLIEKKQNRMPDKQEKYICNLTVNWQLRIW